MGQCLCTLDLGVWGFGCFGRSTGNCAVYSGSWEVKRPHQARFPERCIHTNSPRDAGINKEQGEILRINRALKNGYQLICSRLTGSQHSAALWSASREHQSMFQFTGSYTATIAISQTKIHMYLFISLIHSPISAPEDTHSESLLTVLICTLCPSQY